MVIHLNRLKTGLVQSLLCVMLVTLVGCANPVKTSSMYYADANHQNALDALDETKPRQYLTQQWQYLSVFAGCDARTNAECIQNIEQFDKVKWKNLTENALTYYDGLCYNYLGYIYTRKKWNSEVDRDLKRLDEPTRLLVGTLATPVRAIQVMASVFGVSPALFNVADEAFILSTDMASLMQLVRGVQENFRTNRLAEAIDKNSTVALIRDYAMICSPMGIDYEFSLLQKKVLTDSFQPKSLGGNAPPKK